ncbi:hypothetical protein DYD21_04880 [Rhodohalobacter sp. SW132]|nr:hypothetical protein DYD21_04880 [Rhodohalobacter sp. SW132]
MLWMISLCLVLWSVLPSSAAGQGADSPRATLSGWENHLRMHILDRSNNMGGVYYDRGLFRMHTQDMPMEYEIDLLTYRFSYFDDYDWTTSNNGFRSFVGSLDTQIFAVRSEFRNRINITENSEFNIWAYQQEDIRARRGLFILGYNHRFGNLHTLGLQHTLGNMKADLDASFFYRFGNRDLGFVTVDVTLLDWANNIVSGISNMRQSQPEFQHTYSQRPNLYTLRLESPLIWRFRGEAVVAVQPRSIADVSQRDFPDANFLLEEWVNYQAALFEVLFPGGTAGIIYQRTFTRMQRKPATGSEYELDYGNRQTEHRGGFYLTYRWRSFGVEQWFWIERNRDQQFDENPEAYAAQDPLVHRQSYPFDFNEIRRFNKSRIFYAPEGRLISLYLEHNGDWRTPAYDSYSQTVRAISYRFYYHNQIVSRNERLTLGISFRFTDHSKLTIGTSLDLDGDRYTGWGTRRENQDPAILDGGFARFQMVW